jgi:hypothetical protein
MMNDLAAPAAPAAPAWERLVDALGVPGATPAKLAAETALRVAQRRPAGRVDTRTGRMMQYASAVEAAVDFRLAELELEVRQADSRHAAALDDVRGAWGSTAAVAATAAALEDLRRREWVARDLFPLAARIGILDRLRDAKRELARIPRDPARPRFEPGDVAVPAGATSPEGYEYARKYAMREAAKAAALLGDGSTPWSRAASAVSAIEGRLAAWDDANPKLAALLEAQRAGKV